MVAVDPSEGGGGPGMMSVSAPLPGAGREDPGGRNTAAGRKKTVMVKKKGEQKAAKKQLLVARKPRQGEDIHHEMISNVGSPSKLRSVRRNADGTIVERSIIGGVREFEDVNAIETALGGGHFASFGEEDSVAGSMVGFEAAAPGGKPTSAGSEPPNTARSQMASPVASPSRGSRKGGSGNKTPGSVTGRRGKAADRTASALAAPHSDKEHYLATLLKVHERSETLRRDEQAKETSLLAKLPIQDQFSMNTESKVMRRWTEQQRDWAKMQRGLARHAKKEHGALLMAPNNAYREQTEEYQLIQASATRVVLFFPRLSSGRRPVHSRQPVNK
jgi:hypothetical protein